MTKRRAEEEDTLLCGAPPKRRYGQSLCGGDTRPKGGVSPPSPSPSRALPGSRCRKRPYSTEGPDDREAVFLGREPAASDGVAAESREALRGRSPSSARDGAKKRPRDDDDDGEENRETFPVAVAAATANDDNSDDVSYNSFQFWRNPLPAVDLALLEGGKCAAAKDPALEAMET